MIAQLVERGIVAFLLFINSPQVTGSIPVQKTLLAFLAKTIWPDSSVGLEHSAVIMWVTVSVRTVIGKAPRYISVGCDIRRSYNIRLYTGKSWVQLPLGPYLLDI